MSSIPKYEDRDCRRRAAVYALFKFIGVSVGDSPDSIPDRVVYAFRYIPVSYIVSALIIARLSEGFSYRQASRKLDVSIKEVRTTVKRHRMSHKDPIYIKKT